MKGQAHVGEWRDVALGDVLTLQRGFDLPARDRVDGPVPVVSSSGVTGRHSVAKVDPPGVVIGRYGSLGLVHWVTEPFWPLNTSLWVKDFKGNDPRYISYLLKTIAADGSSAAAVPGVNRNHLHRLSVRVPTRARQQRIGGILASFDDLIAVNNRRIEILCDIARSLFREWFVRFRFPGHERVVDGRSVDEELPSGWVIGAVGDFLDVVGGGTPSKARSEFWENGSVDWFTPSDLTSTRTRFVDGSRTRMTHLGLERSSARLFPAGSVLMTSRATLGVVGIALREATCNQGFIVIRPHRTIPSSFLYEWLVAHEDRLAAIATGATFKEITKTAFKRFPFIMPTPDVLRKFADVMDPIDRQIAMCERLRCRLHAARDLLLPRLVNGRLDISDVDLGDLLDEADVA